MLLRQDDKKPAGVSETARGLSLNEKQRHGLSLPKSVFGAGLASVALHGLGLMLLPYISSFPTSKTSPPPTSIKVIELTPQEVSRIPALTPSTTPTNPLPAAFYQPVLPVPPPANQAHAPSSPLPLSSLSPIVRVSSSPQPLLSASPSPEASRTPAVATSTSPQAPPSRLPVISASTPEATSPDTLAASPTPTPSPPVSVPGNSSSIAVAPAVEVQTDTPETPNRPNDPVAKIQPDNSRGVTDNSPELVFNSSNTTEEEAQTNYRNWASSLGIASIAPRTLSLQADYPEVACQKNLNAGVSVAILIDKDRQPNSPTIVKSSGYQVFDEQAIVDTMSANFDRAAIAQPYLVSLKYRAKGIKCQKNR